MRSFDFFFLVKRPMRSLRKKKGRGLGGSSVRRAASQEMDERASPTTLENSENPDRANISSKPPPFFRSFASRPVLPPPTLLNHPSCFLPRQKASNRQGGQEEREKGLRERQVPKACEAHTDTSILCSLPSTTPTARDGRPKDLRRTLCQAGDFEVRPYLTLHRFLLVSSISPCMTPPWDTFISFYASSSRSLVSAASPRALHSQTLRHFCSGWP